MVIFDDAADAVNAALEGALGVHGTAGSPLRAAVDSANGRSQAGLFLGVALFTLLLRIAKKRGCRLEVENAQVGAGTHSAFFRATAGGALPHRASVDIT